MQIPDTITLSIDNETSAFLSALIDLAKREGSPIERLAAQQIAERMSNAIMDTLPLAEIMEELDDLLAQAPEEVHDQIEAIRQQVIDRKKPEPGQTDMSEFEARLADTKNEEE